jgi:hypothetical protein
MQIPSGYRFAHFETYEEMASRPNFVAEMDLTAASPELPIGIYALREMIKCGIKSCRTPHQLGVLVRMSDGRETLIGHVCGKRKIGIQFESMMADAKRQDKFTRDLEKVSQAASDSAANLARVDVLLDQPQGARWVAQRQAACRRLLSPEALHIVGRMARHDEPTLYRERLMDKREVSIARATGRLRGPGPHYIRTEAGKLRGLEIWKTDLRGVLIDQIQTKLHELANVAMLTADGAGRWAKWVNALPEKYETAERLIAAGREFFATENLEQLKLLGSTSSPIKGLEGMVDKLVRDSAR